MTTGKTSRNTPDRMDLPFVGLATFARQPACLDWDRLDGADVAVPGTATISHGGFSYYESKDILREIAKRFEVVGADFVEVSPPYDPSGITLLLAARTSLDFIGSIFHERAKRRNTDRQAGDPTTPRSFFQNVQHVTEGATQ
jgi:hypothetical protein